jgi:glycosyltransferase involved in cell wall biosynthesis
MKPIISVLAISKNEIANLSAFINSWSEVADEIVILDTGSTDGTWERLLESAHPKVKPFYFAWKNDFSAARNEALRRCRGDWVVWADLDDRIDTASIPCIRQIAELAPKDVAIAFQVASDMGNGTQHRFLQTRMFPRIHGLEWERPVHETLDQSLNRYQIQVWERADIIVAHLGYADPKLKKEKAIRNLAILNQQPQDAITACQIGESLFVLGAWEQGLAAFDRAVAMDPGLADRTAEKRLIGNLQLRRYDAADAIAAAMPASIGRAFWQGELAFQRNRLSEALDFYRDALTLAPQVSAASANEEALVKNAREALARLEGLECR